MKTYPYQMKHFDFQPKTMKKKLRKILVSGILFWWKVDCFYHSDDSRIICVRIWGKDKTGCPLYVNLTSKWVEHLVYSSYPTPKDISVIIEYALAHNWNPSTRGRPHWLKENSDHLELDNFLLTNVERILEEISPFPRKYLDPSYKEAWLKLYSRQEEN